MISTVSANWGLPSLGRWDCGANVLELVANKTGYDNFLVDTTNLFFNASYPGPVSDSKFVPVWPIPDTTAKCAAGQGVLGSVVTTWGQSSGTYNYTNVYPYDNASGNNVGGSAALETPLSSSTATGTPTTKPSGTASGTASGTSGSASASTKSGASLIGLNIMAVTIVAVLVGVLMV